MKIKGDAIISRTMEAGRRANEGLRTEVLVANLAVIDHDHHWLRLDGGVATRVIELPDATTITEGWQLVVQNNGTTDPLEVRKNNGMFTGTLLRSIEADGLESSGETNAYEFTLLDGGTVAGDWFVDELGDPASATADAARFVVNFLASEFPAAVMGKKTLTSVEKGGLAEMTHGRGIFPIMQVHEIDGTDHELVLVDTLLTTMIGDIEITVTTAAEFDGRIIII